MTDTVFDLLDDDEVCNDCGNHVDTCECDQDGDDDEDGGEA